MLSYPIAGRPGYGGRQDCYYDTYGNWICPQSDPYYPS